MKDFEIQLKKRTKEFALRVIKLFRVLPKDVDSQVIGIQLIRCATSVGANYRSACRAKSKKDFLYKINIVEEEADESLFWMALLVESEIIKQEKLEPLMNECNELVSIFTSIGKSTKQNLKSN
jgi:four helix bundle protein